MKQRHKHADTIHAWAEGAEIEYRKSQEDIWNEAEFPGWYENYEYRVKPPTKKYRVALFNNGDAYTGTADTTEGANFCEKDSEFVRWLTDWIEYEE